VGFTWSIELPVETRISRHEIDVICNKAVSLFVWGLCGHCQTKNRDKKDKKGHRLFKESKKNNGSETRTKLSGIINLNLAVKFLFRDVSEKRQPIKRHHVRTTKWSSSCYSSASRLMASPNLAYRWVFRSDITFLGTQNLVASKFLKVVCQKK
jgi:hypothetical protein